MKNRRNKRKTIGVSAKQVNVTPRLTIGVLVENSARYLLTLLKSLSSQKLPFVYEVIVVDNASIDMSNNVLRSFLSSSSYSARLVSFKEKQSGEKLYEFFFKEFKGDYLTVIRACDFLPNPDVLRKLVTFLDVNKKYSAACGKFQNVDKNGSAVNYPLNEENYYTGTDFMLRCILRWQSPSFFNSLVFRRSAIEKRYENLSLLPKDVTFDKRLYFHLLQSGRIKILPDLTYKRRIVGSFDDIRSENEDRLAVYKMMISMEKTANKLYGTSLSFEEGKLNVWNALCKEYVARPSKALAKEYKKIYRLSKQKSLYKISYKREKIRFNKKPPVIENNKSEERKEFYYPLDAVSVAAAKRDAENTPMVSVGMTVYNQEDYVAKAIESVVSQKVNFKYELVIAEDCSTDRSREIVVEYAKRYPDIIKLVLQEKNVGLKEQSRQLRRICKGKYRTHLEGDDYWLTDTRLQKQVDFLESHPDYIAVTGKIKTVDQNNVDCPFPYGDINTIYSFAPEYTLEHFENWLLPSHTGALLYRNVYYKLNDKTRDLYESPDIAGDRKTALFLTMQGRVYCMQEYISVRRIVNSATNFTAVNRSAHPYSMIYGWMCKLEEFAENLCGVLIDLSQAKEKQWIFATHYFFKNPSRISLYHVRRILALSDEKGLYLRILLYKINEKFQKAIKDLGFFGTIAKTVKLAFKMMFNVLFKKAKTPKDTSSVLIGHAKEKDSTKKTTKKEKITEVK